MRRFVGSVRHRVRRLYWRTRRRATSPRLTELLLQRPARLHLGCGDVHLDGWINIDQYPASSADVILDFRRIGDLVPSGSVREVLMVHSLCYLRLWECRDLFQAVYEILEPGGLFVTEFPDAAKCAAAIQAADETADAYIEAIRAFYAFDLGQIARRESYVPYAFGWAAWYLEAELRAAGFAVTRTLTPTTHGGMTWRDSRVEATK